MKWPSLLKALLHTSPPFSHFQLLNARLGCLCLALQYENARRGQIQARIPSVLFKYLEEPSLIRI